MHFTLTSFEQLLADGVPLEEARDRALRTFMHYWNPHNIEAICDPVPPDGWLPGRSYGELRARGEETIRAYAELIRYDEVELLALEFGFVVPIAGTWDDDAGEPHMLAGTTDRLGARRYNRFPVVNVFDWKTQVKEPRYLRHNVQLTAYCYATTCEEFWVGAHGEEGFGPERGRALFQRFRTAARRATWIDLHRLKFTDAGWRGPIDYQRLALAIEGYAAAVKAELFPLSISGETCQFCSYRAVCGGGLPDVNHGNPRKA